MHTPDEAESSGDIPLPATLVKSSTSRRRGRKLTAKELPLVISIVAAIIALLTYVDQHNVDRATVITDEETYAAKVGFWLVSPSKPGQLPEIVVDNAGVLPISNVRLLLTATGYPFVEPPNLELYWFTITEDPIPPCATVTSPVEQIAMSHVRPRKGITYKLSIQSLDFTDASGITWVRSLDGALAQESGGQSGDWQSLSTPIPNKPDVGTAPGCS
jgi:hypothetical protein